MNNKQKTTEIGKPIEPKEVTTREWFNDLLSRIEKLEREINELKNNK